MIRRYWKKILILMLLISIVGTFAALWLSPLLTKIEIGFSLSPELKSEFAKQFLQNADVNNGLTIQLLSFYSNASSTISGDFFEYAVLNHTNESIKFSNAAFGLRIFSPDEIVGTWTNVIPNIPLGNEAILIRQHTETYGTKTNNSFFLLYSDFDENLPKKLRIFVAGIGNVSLRKYIAYVDIWRK